MMEDLIKAYEDRGVKFWVENGQLKFKAPSGTLNAEDKVKLRNVKEKLIEYYERKDKSALKADLSKRYEPFPLTGIQSAYLLGRNHNYEYGGVGCHAYFELSMPHMDAERLESAWHKVIMRHDMLRAVFLQNGTQKILEHVDLPKLTYFNMKEAGAETTDSKLNEIRAELAHKQYQADCWPLFDLYLTDTIDKSILHFSIDMLLSDFISMKTILNDLDAFYYEDGKNLKPLQVSFRDVLVYQKEHENDEEVRTKKDRDCEYWKKRLQNFPDAPELPILPESKCEKVTFTQYRHFITPENWSKLCEKARMQRLTPSGVVLSAYAEIIGRWSKRKDFCIDITILNRPSIHSQINEIVGDFTEVDILEISPEYPSNFVERTRKIQNQLWEDLSHSAFTGIDVLREINRQSEKKAIIPVVYTSTVGAADSEQQENWEFMRNSRITYKISQTPQVWIDCQVSEDNGGVLINWDVRDGVFPEGFVNDAFEAFSLLIERLCTNLKVWEQVHPVELPLKTGKVRKSVNKTEKDLPDKMLHEGFYNCLQNCPDEIALIAAEGTFSYKELGSYVAGIQNELCKSGFRKGDFVAISADKGMWQIAAVLAVLFSGGVYLPFDVSQPIARQNKILEKSGTKYLITNKKHQSLEWKEHIVVLAAEDINRTEQALTIVEIPLENPAYIIHTSGTTGDPKGVVISHKAAVNTIEDINSRFDINSADRMFGLANLAFDLSVYDIFGAFNAGAALVLPDPEKQKDPYYWVETIKKNEITVWNSVPAQMQMLVSVLESRGVSGDFPLKVVLLSGDWIPVTLPDQIHTSCKKAKVVSLGGATEAAIWSIYHEIEEVPDGAVSIPYGKPLANQKFYVLNEKMEQCPDWVPGDLYIGGKGLALEYLNKPEETNAHFMYDEQLQERIYKTGDIGRYWPDGTIEFMGREDTQVKIHGHRIELSEIESALLSNTLVKTAVAVIVGKRPQDYKIVAFVEGNIEVSELTEYIKTQVPEYMVPSRFKVNEKIPLSANGKVERKALKKLAETYFQNTGKCEMPPHEGLEKEIAELWKTLLKIDRVNRTDNFYDIGGDSLLVAQAVSKTKEAINVAKDVEWDRLMIGMLQNPTIMDFAQFLNSVQIGTSHEENEISETPLNIIADIPEGGEVMKVFFPGGIGFLQQFNTLFQILVNNPERTEGIAAFNYTEDKEYLDSEEKDHIVTIGRRYADLLLNSGYRKFKLIGYCMGGLVAIEAARALLEAGAEVLPVVTIDTIPIVLEMEGDLLMERSYGLMVGADVSKAGHVKRDELVQMALELLKDHNNGFIEEDAILGLTGELPELAACYKKQKTLSKRERMENLKNAIPENSMQLSSEDMNRFDELFEIYKRNYRCAIGYTPKPFAGDLQALSCMDDHSPFVPVMKPGTEAFLSKCALGNLEVLPIGGNHLSCLMTPNVEGMANLLDGKGERV